MKLELAIKEDKELRAFIKDMIRGQITSIAREEISAIIKEVVVQKYGDSGNIGVDRIIRDEIKTMVNNELKPKVYNDPGFIKKHAQEEVLKMIKTAFSSL